jgi:putative membrane protein
MIHVIATINALIHVYIFTLESLFWGRARTNKTFGMSAALAESNRVMAFNQGFYNLFLAIGILTGTYLTQLKHQYAGQILVDFCILSILGAGFVLFSSGKNYHKPALVQILPSALYFVLRIIV